MADLRTLRYARLASAAIVLAFLLALEFSAASRPTLQLASDAFQLGLCLVSGVLCLAAARRGSVPARRFWRLLGAGALTWTAAQALWTWRLVGLDPQKLPLLDDLLFWLALVPWLLAVVARPDRPRVRATGLWFDATLVAVLALHVYAYAMAGSLQAGRGAIFVAWPPEFWYVRDGALIGSYVWLVVTAAPPWRAVFAQVLAAMAILHGGDTFSSLFIREGSYHPGLLDLPWTAPFLILAHAAASFRPGPGFDVAPWEPDWRRTRRGMLTATVIVVLVPGTHLAYRSWIEAGAGPFALQGALALGTTLLIGGLLALRQWQLLRAFQEAQEEREKALRRSEERFQKAFEASPAALSLRTRADGRYLDVNERGLALLGYARAEIVGHAAEELGIWIEPAARVALEQLAREEGSVRDFPARFRTRSGEVREVISSVETLEIDGVPCLLELTEDVTERRKLEERLVQSQRLESMGRLAGGIAHDFNNLLGVILGYSSLVLSRLPEDHPVTGKVAQIQRAGERAAGLTRQLLAFSSRQVLVPTVVDLAVLLHDTEKMLGRLIGEDIELATSVAPGLGRVKADPSQIEQVLMNLVVNARDAMPEGGRLGIDLRDVTVESPLPLERGVLPPGAYVVLAVRDSGVGISDDVRDHLFEPFFTTKERGKGTGLGLATVHGIVEQSGGRISVETTLGAGTTFRVYLPRVDDAASDAGRAPAAATPRGSETLLLVEDEDPLREMTREILTEGGYVVLEAENGSRALEVAAAHAGPIHLLLTDVVMPGLSGPKTAERLTALRPGTRVLFASGYTAGELGPHGVLDPSVEFLQKPYTPDDLLARIRDVLDR